MRASPGTDPPYETNALSRSRGIGTHAVGGRSRIRAHFHWPGCRSQSLRNMSISRAASIARASTRCAGVLSSSASSSSLSMIVGRAGKAGPVLRRGGVLLDHAEQAGEVRPELAEQRVVRHHEELGRHVEHARGLQQRRGHQGRRRIAGADLVVR